MRFSVQTVDYLWLVAIVRELEEFSSLRARNARTVPFRSA